MTSPGAECFRCGEPGTINFGNGYLCENCVPSGDSPANDTDDKADAGSQSTGERAHENPIDISDIADAERAELLQEYLEAYVAEFGEVPRLMPLDEEGKAPIIRGKCSLNSPEGRSYLVDGTEAVRQISEEGARGFAIYAGKWDHGTEELALVDVDDQETFPYEAFEPTLTVLSGSGRGEHFTYRNAGDVRNAKGKDGVEGEIRAENWFCVTPGSVHPTGGVYHVIDDRDVATLANDDLPEELQPGSSTVDRNEIVELEPPEDLTNASFVNDQGTSLEDLRERDEKLDALLTNLAPPGYNYPSASEADFATATKLWFWRFDEQQIANIMRAHRRRGKVVDRDGYLATTITKATQGERADPTDPAPEGNGTGRPVAALPLAQLDVLLPADRRRAAKKRGLEWPTTDEARERLFQTVTEVMANQDDRLIDAPTSLGKSYTIASTHWNAPQYEDVTGGKPVIHLSKTRDARDEAIATARDQDVDHFVLRSRDEACPVAAGDYDPPTSDADDVDLDYRPITINGEAASEWLRGMCEGRGITFSAAHRYLEEHNDQHRELPCCEGDTECPAIAQWKQLREEDDLALIEATHQFAHVPGLRMHTNIVFDEEPDFGQDLTQDRIRRAVTAFLKEVDTEIRTFEELLQVSKNGLSPNEHDPRDLSQRYEELHTAFGTYPDQDWYFDNADAHTLAPALARAILNAEDRGNGRRAATVPHEPPRLDAHARDQDGWNREWATVVLDEDNTIRTVRVAPDLGLARSVIGLDAHPSRPVWARNTLPYIETRAVLEPEERQLWRRYERGLRVVQVGDATRPLASGEYFNERKTRAVIDQLHQEYGDDFRTALTASSVEVRTKQLMKDVGIGNPETMHYGEEKSRNDFADEAIGFVNGCIDPGDDFVLDLLAELDLDAEPETTISDDGEEHRAHGRAFIGPDAGTAAEILASVRENHTAQAAGRYARNPDDPSSTATVFVRTDAIPTGFADVQVAGVEWVYSDVQEEIVTALRESSGAVSTREIAEQVDVSKEHVRKTLQRLVDREAVHAIESAGEHGATLYADVGLPNQGIVDLGERNANDLVWDSYTWSLAICAPGTLRSADDGVINALGGDRSEVWDWRPSADAGD